MTRQSVLKEIEEKNRVYSIKIIGSEKDKVDGFYILMNTQNTFSDDKDTFHGIKKSTLELLDKAEIIYDIL
jgi:hypothetical protein